MGPVSVADLVEARAPSNTPLLNAAWRNAATGTGGANLIRGAAARAGSMGSWKNSVERLSKPRGQVERPGDLGMAGLKPLLKMPARKGRITHTEHKEPGYGSAVQYR